MPGHPVRGVPGFPPHCRVEDQNVRPDQVLHRVQDGGLAHQVGRPGKQQIRFHAIRRRTRAGRRLGRYPGAGPFDVGPVGGCRVRRQGTEREEEPFPVILADRVLAQRLHASLRRSATQHAILPAGGQCCGGRSVVALRWGRRLRRRCVDQQDSKKISLRNNTESHEGPRRRQEWRCAPGCFRCSSSAAWLIRRGLL